MRRKKAMQSGKVVSGMPDGGDVSTRNSATRDDLEAAYEFTKKQKRRSPK